jgi:Cu/Ag efflux protein CusF
MKKALMFVLAVLISVAFVATVFAQAKPEVKPADKPAAVAPEKAPAPEKKAEAAAPEKKAAKKPASKTFKGEFVSMDDVAKTIVAKGKKGEMTFDVSAVKKMPELKAGDKIIVVYTEADGKMVAKKVTKAAKKAPKAKKEAPKKEEVKPAAEAPAAPAKAEPAPAPAPAKK